MSRWKASAIHLSISAAIGLVAAALIFGVWYPSPYGKAAGATELVLLLLGVDVVLGPLLTLIVFKTGKKSLRFDLSVIAVLQACAFLYGMSVVTRARPAFIVAAVDRFVLVSANDLDPADLAQGSAPEFRSLSWTGPKVVGAVLPTSGQERNDLLFSGMAGKDVEKFPKHYVPYADIASAMLKAAHPLATLHAKHPEAGPPLEAWLRQTGREADRVVWLPLTSRRADLTVLLDPADGTVLDALPIDPW
ncbi:TfpX/TfpZ family type IV pilin accessory protein [Dokdonella ginsengisoli]|uniref:TfpX/TfpZ family type IV pilin accessory protein n=1 Tax=Dokdonella ginsengisoli TaxID=363846 RepID=A0ABV9QSK5_9GAMM